MRRGSRFAIGLAAAALTFGSLWAFVGPKHRGYCHSQRFSEERWQHHGGCHDGHWGDEGQEKSPDKTQKDSPTL